VREGGRACRVWQLTAREHCGLKRWTVGFEIRHLRSRDGLHNPMNVKGSRPV
jgi:hypothetical protein